MEETTDVYHRISKLQFHYWFSDKTHTMDALVYNKCERELLELTKLIAKLCGVAIKMETEPTGKGGLKSWLTIAARTPRKTPAAKVALVHTLVAATIATPHQTPTGTTTELLLESLLGHEELKDSDRTQRRQEVDYLKREVSNLLPHVDQSSVVKKRRSNFYNLLRKYQKVKSISVTLTDDTKKAITEEQMVVRDNFKKFLVSTDAVAPQVIEHAQIEIISPVLVKGRHKWKGVYNGSPISFIMKSDDFMSMVQSGKVEFKSGTTITCTLEIEKKLNSAGVERITGYNILGVGSFSENGKTTETTEEKQKQKHNTVSKRQLDLFG